VGFDFYFLGLNFPKYHPVIILRNAISIPNITGSRFRVHRVRIEYYTYTKIEKQYTTENLILLVLPSTTFGIGSIFVAGRHAKTAKSTAGRRFGDFQPRFEQLIQIFSPPDFALSCIKNYL
jgi:hypothetical protein